MIRDDNRNNIHLEYYKKLVENMPNRLKLVRKTLDKIF